MLLHEPDGCIVRSMDELNGRAPVADRTNGNSEFISKAGYKRELDKKRNTVKRLLKERME